MTNLAHGLKAEQVAAEYLTTKGYQIVDRNWKTSWCEVDIVAKSADLILLVEVKYRQSASYGQGFDYITDRKLSQMARAAEGWVQARRWSGDYRLAAIQVSGHDYIVDHFIDDL